MTVRDSGTERRARYHTACGADKIKISIAENLEDLRELTVDLAAQSMLQRYSISDAELWSGWQVGHKMKEFFWQAHLGRRVVGMARAAASGGFSGPYLRFIGIASDCQSKGIGGLLLRTFQTDLASCAMRGYFLLVADFNHRAHQFYKSHGYQHVGVLPGFVQKGINEFIFWRPFQAQKEHGSSPG